MEEALVVIGTLPSLAPRPTATNIRALEIDLVNNLTKIPSKQSVDVGYAGKVEADIVYALKTSILWVDWLNPGPYVTLADNLTDTQITNIQEEYKARKMVWDSQSNVNRAVIAGLNLAIPRTSVITKLCAWDVKVEARDDVLLTLDWLSHTIFLALYSS